MATDLTFIWFYSLIAVVIMTLIVAIVYVLTNVQVKVVYRGLNDE